ncbi:MAG TPA: ATP-binding protein [Rhizomicrobium sp.]
MSFARIMIALLIVGCLAVIGVALESFWMNGTLALPPPFLWGTTGILGVLILFVALVEAHRRTRVLEANAAQLQSLTTRLEESLDNVSSVNGRLNESEVRYKGLVDAQGDAIFRRGPDSRLTYANDAFYRLFRLTPPEAIGHAFAPEPHPDCRSPIFSSFAELEAGQARMRYDQNVRTAYGWRWIAWEDYAIRDELGRLIEVQSVGRDITERKALEDALTEARDRAEGASRAKSHFLATMSHEIRTPMNGVLGMARLLQETKLLPAQRTYAHAIEQSGEALLTLIEEILDFSKIESGTLQLEEEDTDIRSIVGGVAELLAPRAHAKGIELVTVIAPDVPAQVHADGVRLRQILTNLVGNAIKFTERGGVRIDLNSIPSDGRRVLRFDVRDTGVGVPAEKQQDIFREFVQADSTHARRFGGSGLGLAISKRLVEAMEGDIGVQSAPGGGSLFWFTVPVRVLKEAEPMERLAGTRVAIVTRNGVLREGIVAQIRALGGEVVPLWLPGSAESHALSSIDAVLIDAGTAAEIDLPAWPNRQTRSIVMLTPGARGKLREMKDVGFDAYLVKPVRLTSLVDRFLRQTGDDMAEREFRSRGGALPSGKGAGKRSLRILLAEDNPINGLLTRELLRRRGHEIRQVESGEGAIAAMRDERFDLFLTDIHMPGLDGIEAARRIRAHEDANGKVRTPIIAVTADALETGRQACKDAGMNGFLTKPIAPSEIDTMLAELFPDPDRAQEAAA